MPCPIAEQGTLFCSKSGKYAAPGLVCHRCYSAIVEMRTKGEVISNPGRRLALCVAPYFADRGVGDMRGDTNGTPICHPGGGGRPSLHTQPCGTQDDTHRTTAEAQPRTTSGVRLCTGAIWHAPHVATTPRGEIRGYARLPPPPGWRKCSPPVIVSAVAEMRMLRMLVTWSGAHFLPCGHSTPLFLLFLHKNSLFDIF